MLIYTGEADEGRRVERALQERDVAEGLEIARGGRVAFQPITPESQQHKGQVGPLLLAIKPSGQCGQCAHVRRGERFLRDDDKGGSGIKLGDERRERRAGLRGKAASR